jgi:RNA polymerase sigma factor (sigma-70 family)
MAMGTATVEHTRAQALVRRIARLDAAPARLEAVALGLVDALLEADDDTLAGALQALRDARARAEGDPALVGWLDAALAFAHWGLERVPSPAAVAQGTQAHDFLRALDGLPRFREQGEPPNSSFRVWLFQICRNTLANERRRVRRHPEASLDFALEVPSTDDVQAEALDREQLARAWRHIGQLSAERRQALVLRFVEEMSTREIGEVLGRSEGATRVLIHRALQAVARQLGRGSGAAGH